MSDRRKQLLMNAIHIIAVRGYGGLSMRALARESGMKLGALQYHFPTWRDLLRDLAELIRSEYATSLPALTASEEPPHITTLVAALMDDVAGEVLQSEQLLPQLWAMGRVEPVMGELLEGIYEDYLLGLETSLANSGCANPRAEALSLMSLIEGSTLFLHKGSPWASDAASVKNLLIHSVQAKYGDP